MNTETTIDTPIKPLTWWIKYKPESNKIIGVSTRELTPSKKFKVITSNSELCRSISQGKTSMRDCGIVWDIENEQWDIQEKSDTLVLSEYSSQLMKVTESGPLHSDMHILVYKEDAQVELSVNFENIKTHLNIASINNVVQHDGVQFNLYFTHRNDPDYLILAVQVDPSLLFKNKKLTVDISDLPKFVDWDDLSIFTRPILHRYTVEYMDRKIITDYTQKQHRVLQQTAPAVESHITLEYQGNRVNVIKNTPDDQNYVFENKKNLKFLVCDSTIDNIVGGFTIDIAQLCDTNRISLDTDFTWPKRPIIVYKNKYLSVEHTGI